MRILQIICSVIIVVTILAFHGYFLYRHKKLIREGWKVTYFGCNAVPALIVCDAFIVISCIVASVLIIMDMDCPTIMYTYAAVGIIPVNAMQYRVIYRKDNEFMYGGKIYSLKDISDVRKDPYSLPNVIQVFFAGKSEPLSIQIPEKYEADVRAALLPSNA